jgi:hypothetical protein
LRAESDCLTCNLAAAERWMKWPHRTRPEREQQNRPFISRKKDPFVPGPGRMRKTEDTELVTSFEEWRATASALAAETTGCQLEPSAWHSAGPQTPRTGKEPDNPFREVRNAIMR